MDGLLDLAESQMQMALAELPAGTHRFSDRMDNGARNPCSPGAGAVQIAG